MSQNIAIDQLKTEKDKRDLLIAIFNNSDHEKHKKLKKLLKGRDILGLKEDEMDKIIGIFLIEAEGGE